MAQTIILASGTTAATSSNIVLADGATVLVSLFSADAIISPQSAQFDIRPVTPGATLSVGQLNITRQSVQITGPGTFNVSRPAMVSAVGICVDD